MTDFEEDCLEALCGKLFQLDDLGPLRGPIHKFSLRRNAKLDIILETEGETDILSALKGEEAGTVRIVMERATLKSPTGAKGELIGVLPHSWSSSQKPDGRATVKETSSVSVATFSPPNPGVATHTIDWLENLQSQAFIWPDGFKTSTTTNIEHSIGPGDVSLHINKSWTEYSSGQAAIRLTIQGVTIYVCAIKAREGSNQMHPGCIIYSGTPNDAFRKKIRTALSFTLGLYLIDLGHTLYDDSWHIVHAVARHGYALGGKAFEMYADQLAPLGSRYLRELGRSEVTRMVSALASAHDELDLANLAWAYWHACSAAPHMAPAHFGAAIESLQRDYLKAHPESASTSILPESEWRKVKAKMRETIEALELPPEAARTLSNKLPVLNNADQRTVLKSLFNSLGLQLSEDEDSAWKRRNKAAHGAPIPEGDEVAAIRDMKLLKGLFQRLLLRVTGASDMYIDRVMPGHPYRPLQHSPANLPK